MNVIKNIFCRVCGFNLNFFPWKDGCPADEICPCCSIQYGYDDQAGGNLNARHLIYDKWRSDWIKDGMPWRSLGSTPPHNWDPETQMKNLKDHIKITG